MDEAKIKAELRENPGASGADICRATGLSTATVYPILSRLESSGQVRSEWDQGAPKPRRRRYVLA